MTKELDLSALITAETDATQAKLDQLKTADSVSQGDMLAMQEMMNRLSQLSEMSSSVIAASDSALASMARNVKN
ncbi:DUF5407 family protein [Mycolicibacterium sp. P1-5]|uniref:DUF5407 family protein n=1 Tax=Mycolicibacterium sp. P1-5 TaxID=2024617 RepID=UPI0011EC36D0|nr:DUF5407 family protein [Mycolicibacterium sp. P1-5]KAA0112065.1 type III secretion system needle subunit protein SctF [Mycolicibacterium sp. P1-5]